MKLAIILTVCVNLVIHEVYSQEIYIDHVISVVHDLDMEVEKYERMGFTIKPGTIHDNGLVNAHIKFANNSAFELMSIVGSPNDAIAQRYRSLLDDGEGGVYICLSGIAIERLRLLLSDKGYAYNFAEGKFWSYITFPDDSMLAPFFFIDYHHHFEEDNKYHIHENNCKGFKVISIEGNSETNKFLSDIGLKTDSIQSGQFQTHTGSIKVIEHSGRHRPRILSIVFDKR